MEDVRPTSPTQEARRLAAEGAAAAAAAVRAANDLNWRTRRTNDTRELYNTKVPRVALSDSAFEAERQRTAPPVAVAASRYCHDDSVQSAVPAVHSMEESAQLHQCGAGDRVDTIRLSNQLSNEEAFAIFTVLSDPHCVLRRLSLSNAFNNEIEPNAALVSAAAQEVRAEFVEGSEETMEKIQAAVEKQKGEFTTYNKAVEFLARKRADPLRVILQAIGNTNTSLRELRLDANGFGAPNADGRANYQALRRLAKMVDANNTIRVLDVSANLMGPVGTGILSKALTKNIAIHSLDISGNDINGEAPEEDEDPELEEDDPVFGEMMSGLESLSEVLKKNKFLRKLSMRHNRLKADIDEAGEDDGLETPLGKFLEPLKKYHRLQVLDLSCNELSAGGAKMIASALAFNKSVVLLDLSDNNLGPKGLQHMATLLSKTSTLQSLVLQKNDLSGKKGKRAQKEAHAAMLQFAAALASNQTLTSLNIAGNHLGPELAADFLSTITQAAGRLKTLDLESNEICGLHHGEFHDSAIRSIAQALATETCAISNLNLSGNHVQASGIQALLEVGPAALHSVEELNLSRNGLGDEGLSLLARQLPFLERLTTVFLSHNTLFDPTPLTHALRTSPSIRNVHLDHNLLGDCKSNTSLVDLIDVIGNKPQYESLDLSCNELRDEHAKALAYLCHTATPPFRSLLLQGNPAITIDETIKMVQALARNTSIRVFKCSAQEGDHLPLIQAIQQALIQNKTLEDVDVGLSLDVVDERDIIADIKRQLLQNALNSNGSASLQSTFQPF